MELCLLVRIASITRPNVSSLTSRKNEILPKGKVTVVLEVDLAEIRHSAKYIEGLENRLGRMESLLRMSGLLNEEDGDRTDLGSLEKQLANRSSKSNSGTPDLSTQSGSQSRTRDSQHSTPQMDKIATPKSSVASPEPPKHNEAEVEELSDMMCSLVTNNCGETRYIGMYHLPSPGKPQLSNVVQGRHLAFPFSLPKESNGSTRRLATALFKT